METNAKIRNKLSVIKNLISLINEYENATSGERKRVAIECIVRSKSDLQAFVDELIAIKQ